MTATSRDPAGLLCAQLEAIFCPALDPALVAAIAYEPHQSFDQASQILSQLVPDDDPLPPLVQPTPSSPSPSSHSRPSSPIIKEEEHSPASDPISETQLHDLLDQWEAQGAISIPADDDPLLNLTDEESDPQHKDQLPSSPVQKDISKSPQRSTSPPSDSISPTQQGKDDPLTDESENESTLPFLLHAFPRLSPHLLSSILASNNGNLTTTLDELITAQLIADDPGLQQSELPPPPPSHQGKKEKGGLDLDQLALGTRALALGGEGGKKKERKVEGEGMARTRSAGPLVRLGDVRQRGGGDSVGNERRKMKDLVGEAGWKDPKDRLALAIPAHLLQEASSSTSSSSTSSLPNTPFRSTFDLASDEGVQDERRRAIDDAVRTQIDMRKIASRNTNTSSSRRTLPEQPLAETSTWLLTSSVLSQLIHLLRPIPFSSPSAAALKQKRRRRNPPLFSEVEANAVHARSSFHLPRTLGRLIGRSAEVYDSFHRSLLNSAGDGKGEGEGEWAREKAIAAAFDLDELSLTIAALAGVVDGESQENRAKMALKATGGRAEEGGDPDAALDLLELWSGVESQFGGAATGGDLWERERREREEEEKPWTEVVKPIRRSAVRQFLESEEAAAAAKKRVGEVKLAHDADAEDYDDDEDDDDEDGISDEDEQEVEGRNSTIIDVYALPTLAQAAHIASTRKAAQALAAQRRTVQTAATVLKRDPNLTLSPAAAAQQARDAIARERLAHARRGAAIVLPASASAVGFGDDQEGGDDEEGAEMGLAARRRRALERLDYASRMETEYREKRRDALRKASSAWRGISSSSSSSGGQAATMLMMQAGSRDRAEVPGSATYFGLPEQPRPKNLIASNGNGFSSPILPPPPSIPSSAASLAPSSTKALRGSAAWYYADEARRLDAKARSWGLKAAQALVEERKLAHVAAASLPTSYGVGVGVRKAERNVIDLHLLTTGEALAVVKEEIDKWWWSTPRGAASTSMFSSAPSSSRTTTNTNTSSAGAGAGAGGYGFRPLPAPYIGFGPGPLHIITGIGKHSRGNVAVLRPAVCGWLKRGGWDYEEDAPRGRIVVKGFKGRSD